MRKVLDLGELLKHLRQTEEHEPHFDEVLNPYLLHTVLPQLESCLLYTSDAADEL